MAFWAHVIFSIQVLFEVMSKALGHSYNVGFISALGCVTAVLLLLD